MTPRTAVAAAPTYQPDRGVRPDDAGNRETLTSAHQRHAPRWVRPPGRAPSGVLTAGTTSKVIADRARRSLRTAPRLRTSGWLHDRPVLSDRPSPARRLSVPYHQAPWWGWTDDDRAVARASPGGRGRVALSAGRNLVTVTDDAENTRQRWPGADLDGTTAGRRWLAAPQDPMCGRHRPAYRLSDGTRDAGKDITTINGTTQVGEDADVTPTTGGAGRGQGHHADADGLRPTGIWSDGTLWVTRKEALWVVRRDAGRRPRTSRSRPTIFLKVSGRTGRPCGWRTPTRQALCLRHATDADTYTLVAGRRDEGPRPSTVSGSPVTDVTLGDETRR